MDQIITLEALFQQGVDAYQQGHKQQAINIFNQIIAQQPNNIEVLQALITIYREENEIALAERYLTNALAIAPDNPSLRFDEIQLSIDKKETQKAWQLIEKLDQEFPNNEQILLLKQKIAFLLNKQEDLAQINEQLRQINIRKESLIKTEIDETLKLAKQFVEQAHWEQAELLLEASITADPILSGKEAHLLLAQSYQKQNKLEQARKIYASLHKNEPDSLELLSQLIYLTIDLSEFEQAKALIKKELTRFSYHPDLNFMLMRTHCHLQEWSEGWTIAKKLYASYQDPPIACYYAITQYKTLKESNTIDAKMVKQVIHSMEKTLKLLPDSLALKKFLIQVMIEAYRYQGEPKKAIQLADLALKDPSADHARLFWLKSQAHLHLKERDSFLRCYAYGLTLGERHPMSNHINHTHWHLDRPKTDHVLLLAEQGVGDELRFLLFLPSLIKRTAHITLVCDQRLIPLFNSAFPFVSVYGVEYIQQIDESLLNGWISKTDSYLFMGELLNLAHQERQAEVPYIKTPIQRYDYWFHQIGQLKKIKQLVFGVCWRSSLRNSERNVHYMTIKEIGFLLTQLPEAIFVNLQYDDCSEEISELKEKFNIDLITFNELNLKDNFVDTAALIEQLDGVITAGTAIYTLTLATAKTPVYLFSASHNQSNYQLPFRDEKLQQSIFEYPPLIGSKIPVVKAMVKTIRQDYHLNNVIKNRE